MNKAFLDYYRCPEYFAEFRPSNGHQQSPRVGFFRFGSDLICYGVTHTPSKSLSGTLTDVSGEVAIDGRTCCLPFNPTEITDNLRRELYVDTTKQPLWKTLVRKTYYQFRPAMPVTFRRHLQRVWLNQRSKNGFPSWPLDRTVDRVFEKLMSLAIQSNGGVEVPFIWFWPDDKNSAAVMTHDVETQAGIGFVDELMDMNDAFGIKSSFQLIPEERYEVQDATLSAIRSRGFEINVHDLKHDGHLFDDHEQFVKAAEKINRYAERFESKGFRSGVLYRNQSWYSAFSFSYDMSVPNNAHFDPQPGGCCTVMPYFVGNILELPVTTIQDYSLFNILGTYSTDLWKQQVREITAHHGMATFIVHPDYLDSEAARIAYKDLLSHLDGLRSARALWIALPSEVDVWWRQRSQMRLAGSMGQWKIEGPGSHRARVAYAKLVDGQLTYRLN
jgi:hypothetical protein